MTDLALQPHHDGSALYVANQKPKLGDKGHPQTSHPFFIWCHLKQVMVRQSDSGEGFLTPKFKVFAKRHGWSWYEGQIVMYNPEIHYRFYIELRSWREFLAQRHRSSRARPTRP